MADKAQQIEFLLSQVRADGVALSGGTATFYEAGTTTLKTVYTDRNKTSTASNPYTLDANATAQLYGDGLYKVVIKNSAGVTKYTRDNLSFGSSTGSTQVITPYSSLTAAVTAIGSTPTDLYITQDTTCTADTTVPSNINLIFGAGADVNQGVHALTINGGLTAPFARIFSGSGTVTFGVGSVKEIYPEWWGAKPDDSTNSATAIQAAINAAGANPSCAIFFSKGVYIITSGLTITGARVSFTSDDNAMIKTASDIDMLTISGGNGLMRGLHFFRSGGTGKGIVLNAPEWKFYGTRISGGHSVGLEMSGAYLTTLHKVYLSGNAYNIKDLGTSQASEFVGCNLYGATTTNLVWDSKGLTVFGGAIEQSAGIEAAIGTNNSDAIARFYGVHFEGTNAATERMIVAGPLNTTGNVQIVIDSCAFFGNSATRILVQLRGVDSCRIANNRIESLNAASTIYDVTYVARNIMFLPSKNTTAATYKTINVSAQGIIDFETESTAITGLSLTQGASGGTLAGIQAIKTIPRASSLVIDSKRNNAGTAIDIRTPGADNTTLYSRIQVTSGANVGVVSFPSARVEVGGSYTAYFKIGEGYIWVDTAGKLRIKTGTEPTGDGDGVVVGTQL